MIPEYDASRWQNWLLFGISFPAVAGSWLLAGLSLALFLARRPGLDGAGILTLEWRSWFAKRWPYSTSLGRVIWFQPNARGREDDELDSRSEQHERVHIRQVEDASLAGLIYGVMIAAGFWAHGHVGAGFAWWAVTWWVFPWLRAVNFGTAALRYGRRHAYRDSEHERSAYAQTDIGTGGLSWWEERDMERQDAENGG
jgi:hypothetical protein